jgi:uncharacterized protein (TIGR00730 family)
MNRLCVYCGSSTGTGDAYVAAARELGELLLRQEIGLVYGGSNLGIMGTIADTVLAGGGNVTGIIPHALHGKEIAHTGLTELHVVDSMHERKSLMAVLSDGFIAMPGGFGTLEEIIEVITWGQLGFHDKPCGLLNIGGYFKDFCMYSIAACCWSRIRQPNFLRGSQTTRRRKSTSGA